LGLLCGQFVHQVVVERTAHALLAKGRVDFHWATLRPNHAIQP